MESYEERQRLIPSIAELSIETQQQFEHTGLYASSQQAFYEQSIFQYVTDEVDAMLRIMFCQMKWCHKWYNPIYLITFSFLFLFTFPGAALHYLLFCCVPVRYREYPEEREMRSQGIYTAMGIAMVSIILACVSFWTSSDGAEYYLLLEMSIAVNSCVILISLSALKAIADELLLATRVYIAGVWLIDIILIILTLFDVYEFLTLSAVTVINLIIRVVQIFVYTVIGVQLIPFWNLYDPNRSLLANMSSQSIIRNWKDWHLAALIGFLLGVVLFCLLYTIIFSEEKAWKLLYWG
jgi:hypothetical protein